jgi:hypothetical protein
VRCAVALLLALALPTFTNSEELKDPTRPPGIIAPGKHSDEHKVLPHVTAIFLSGTRRIAIFNAQPVHAGDRVDGYHIDEIAAEGVRYSMDGHSGFALLHYSPAAVSNSH